MKHEEYLKELKRLYDKAVKNENISLAFTLLQELALQGYKEK